MSTTDIVGIVIAVVVVAVFAAVTVRIVWQRRALRERFGDEYDRAVADKGGRAAAEAELRQRQRRHDELPLEELSGEARAQFIEDWTTVQSQFVDDPKSAVHEADRLVSRIVADHGYPVVDYSDRLAHLSVDHAHVLNHYRDAHDVSLRNDAGQATTEELRQALVNYRALIADLLGDSDVDHETSPLRSSVAPTAEPEPAPDLSDASTTEPAPATDPSDASAPIASEPTLVPDASTRIEE